MLSSWGRHGTTEARHGLQHALYKTPVELVFDTSTIHQIHLFPSPLLITNIHNGQVCNLR